MPFTKVSHVTFVLFDENSCLVFIFYLVLLKTRYRKQQKTPNTADEASVHSTNPTAKNLMSPYHRRVELLVLLTFRFEQLRLLPANRRTDELLASSDL